MPLQDRDDAVFEAFAPVGDPQIAVGIVIEHGGEGGEAAAPIARKLMDYYLIQEGHIPVATPAAKQTAPLPKTKR